MYANFYDIEDNCLFSVEISSERQGEDLADKVYGSDNRVEDWSITDEPISEELRV